MSAFRDDIDRGLSWAKDTRAWVKEGLGDEASLSVTIGLDINRREVCLVRDRHMDALRIIIAAADRLIAVDDDGDRIIEGDPKQFWAKLRAWARSPRALTPRRR